MENDKIKEQQNKMKGQQDKMKEQQDKMKNKVAFLEEQLRNMCVKEEDYVTRIEEI